MFFDFEAPLCLSVAKNTGVVERLTPSILSALNNRTLILLEGEMPGSKGAAKAEIEVLPEAVITTVSEDLSTSVMTVTAESITASIQKEEEPVEEEPAVTEEPVVEEKKPTTKRTSKKPKAE